MKRKQTETARSIRRTLESLSREAQGAELDFVAYLIGMAIVELDDVIASRGSGPQ